MPTSDDPFKVMEQKSLAVQSLTVLSSVSALRLKGSLFPSNLIFVLCSSGCFSKLSLAQAWISGDQNVSPGNWTPSEKGGGEIEHHSEAKQTQKSEVYLKSPVLY